MILLVVVITIVFSKRTANAETFETLPRITDETINVESVSGSAIGYDEGEGNTDIKDNSNKITDGSALYDLMEAQAQGAHTHTEDCYDGHRHTPVYGSTNTSSVPIKMQRGYKAFDKWYYFVDYICSRDSNPIFSVRWMLSGTDLYGYTSVYSYDSYGNSTETRYNFTVNSVANATKYYEVYNYVNSLVTLAEANGATSANNYITTDMYFNIPGVPYWDNSGNLYYLPYKGCTYKEAHPNATACFPIGKLDKVKVSVTKNFDEQGPYIVVEVKSATSNQTLLNLYVIYHNNWQTSVYRAGVQAVFNDYSANGSVIQRNYNSMAGSYSSINLSAWSGKVSTVFDWIESKVVNLPKETFNSGSGYYNFITPAIDWPFTSIPVMYWAGDLSTVQWEPVRGDLTGVPYGTYFSCGQVQDTTPTCDQVVTSIVPTYLIQTIYAGNPIDKSAIATYLDGSTKTINCTSNFDTNVLGSRTATLSYSGLIDNAKTNGTKTTTSQITVLAGLVSITPTISNLTVYKGDNPVLTATATYMDTHTSLVTPINNFNPNVIGTQIVTLSFTDQGMTKTATCTIVVKPNLTSLTVAANSSSVLYSTDIVFTTTAHYEDGSSKTVTAVASTPYSKSLLGSQTVGYSYTENTITKSSTVNVTVLDYPINLSVTLQNNDIYQDCDVIISSYTVSFASGATSNDAVLNRSDFDNILPGPKIITYSYELNGVTVSCDKVITIKPDLYDITLDTNTFEIYRGQEPEIKVTANFNISGDNPLTPEEFTITGFHINTVDRTGTYYTLSYTSKGITISKQVFIRVLPNITSMTVSVPPQTTEGIHIPFSVIVQYEDGINVTITDADIGGESGSRLSMQGYDINKVGYQDITFQFSEGGRTLTETVNIRVRALINISIPLNMLISIDPNISGPGGTISPDIILNNASKEPVIISVQSIVPIGGNELNDVLPTAHPDWTNLGKRQSKDIAIGLNCKNNWLINYLESPLYIAQITSETDVGQIEKESVGSIELLINHGNSHSEHREFKYSILWRIRLIE